MMLRITKPLNYQVLSPSRDDVKAQSTCECLPLVMEPITRLYVDPVVVLDFRSLYPSIIIAYNLCYSTILGKMTVSPDGKTTGKLGATAEPYCYDHAPVADLHRMKDSMFIAPNRAMFASHAERPGVLPRMLREILQTRVMVKRELKRCKKSSAKVLSRVLSARQLGLKLIANVTYGYTAAGFSGRMPCVDIADAIVETGRQTLERAIDTIKTEFKQYVDR